MTSLLTVRAYFAHKEKAMAMMTPFSPGPIIIERSKARRIDAETARMIETGDISKFSPEQACGAIGICGLVEFANQNNYSMIRINMLNSSAASGDKSRVVGYGTWFLYEGKKNEFIKKYYSEYLLTLCRRVILSKLKVLIMKVI